MSMKKPGNDKKPAKKKGQLKDLPKPKSDLTAEQARRVKGGDDPAPGGFPTRPPPPPPGP